MEIQALSAAYFVNEILIPNVTGTTVLELANLKNLQIAVNKYEPLFLRDLLGDDLYTSYVAGIATGSPEAKWVNLNNQIYTVFTSPSFATSPCANYVYFMFMQNQNSITLAYTEVKANHENFTYAGSGDKMVTAWNEMVRMSELIQQWIQDNRAIYTQSRQNQVTFERINSLGI